MSIMAFSPRLSTSLMSKVLLQNAIPSIRSNTVSTSQMSIIPIIPTSTSIPAFSITIPGILADIWEGILKAVPKKKTSHMKKRHRQLAGKALKDVNAVNSCPGCGKPKKAHTLCPYCVAEIQQSWKEAAKAAAKESVAS